MNLFIKANLCHAGCKSCSTSESRPMNSNLISRNSRHVLPTSARSISRSHVRICCVSSGIAYRSAGIGIRTGRLLTSLIDPTHPEHISEITPTSITEGTRVPYAVFIEGRNPTLGRIARSNTLAQFLGSRLEDHIVNE